MKEIISAQTMVFGYAVLFGMILGMVYDVFRITRIAFKHSTVVIAVQDIFYLLVCAVVTFFYMLTVTQGQIRIFIFIGELIGWVFYYFTIGELVIGVSSAIIKFIKRLLAFLYKLFILPIFRLIHWFLRLLSIPLGKSKKIFKKMQRNTKFRLKNRTILLYNLIKGVSPQKEKLQVDGWEENAYEQEAEI